MNSPPVKNYVLRSATGKDEKNIRDLISQKNIKWVKVNPIGITWKRFAIAESMHGEFIGCGKIKRHFDGSQELASIVVVDKYRQIGVAKAIIEYLLSENKRPIYGMCPQNHVSYYSKIGFCVIKENEYPLYFKLVKNVVRIVCFLLRQKGRLIILRLG